MPEDEKRNKNIRGKIIHDTTPEERFKEVHGITIEEWTKEGEEKIKVRTEMSSEEWYIKKVNSSTPIDYLKILNGAISKDDVELVRDLQELGLNDGVINVLFDYVRLVNRMGFIHSLVREMGGIWLKENILTIESAIVYVRGRYYN